MHILHVVPTYLPATRYGGPIFSVHNLCKSLVARGHKVTVFTTNVDGKENSAVPVNQAVNMDGVDVWYFPSTVLRRLYYSPPMLSALCEQMRNFDVVHTHSVFLWPTLVAARVAKKFGKPYVVSPRGMLVKSLFKRKNQLIKSLWYFLFEKKTIDTASAIHVTSQREKCDLQAFNINEEKVHILPNIVEPLNLKVDCDKTNFADIELDRDYILYIGRISWKKGLDFLVKAIAHLPDVALYIAGGDEENYTRQLQQLIRQLELQDRVNFLGEVGQDKKVCLMQRAKLLALTSENENFGNVVAEAMSSALPVVVTDGVGISDMVNDGKAGIVVQQNEAEIASALKRLLTDDALRQRLGKNGENYAAKHFSPAAVGAATESLYQSLCGLGLSNA